MSAQCEALKTPCPLTHKSDIAVIFYYLDEKDILDDGDDTRKKKVPISRFASPQLFFSLHLHSRVLSILLCLYFFLRFFFPFFPCFYFLCPCFPHLLIFSLQADCTLPLLYSFATWVSIIFLHARSLFSMMNIILAPVRSLLEGQKTLEQSFFKQLYTLDCS